ncbi:alpha-hydroxy-acid oxidizing protein [Paraburkholderia sp. LEh10]|uniref:alpha-hydroxy-acid oxidizing protein n=1 Tax=Paraburkholderia sp. LEh10 TaxID=2821353 RepID=UPI001FD82C77|nr:alpha-hydroxy-acid oxidizing protein [Paraburkholderia sp. LEh10]
MTKKMKGVFDVDDYRAKAKKRLPAMVFDYLEGAADDESGLHQNRAAFDRWEFCPRRLVDVSAREQRTRLLGKSLPTPLVIAPTGLNGAFWPKGDVALAKAAAAAGIPFALSTASNMSIEEVAREVQGDLWFQLYVVHKNLAKSFVERAWAAEYSTLILTTDVAVNGFRKRDLRNGFAMPFRTSVRAAYDGLTHPKWLWSYLTNGMPQLRNFATDTTSDTAAQAAVLRREMDAGFDWDDLKRLRDAWPGKLLVKGILTSADAARCIEAGADGVILSNHGARQHAGLPVPANVIAAVRDAVPASDLIVDSGVRTGADVVKAIALGANAVMLGRATLYGLAANGEAGVADVLAMIRRDIDRTLALIGCPAISALTRDFVAERPLMAAGR